MVTKSAYWLSSLFPLLLCVQESKAILTQAKHTRTASAHLSSHLDSALQLLAEQEMVTDRANSQTTSEVLNTDIYTFEQQNLCILICTPCAQLKGLVLEYPFLFSARVVSDQHKRRHGSSQASVRSLFCYTNRANQQDW